MSNLPSAEIIPRITACIVRYERGDLVCLSEIDDCIDELLAVRRTREKADSAAALVRHLKTLTAAEFKGSLTGDLAQSLSEGIDLLQKLESAVDPERRNSIIEEIKALTSLMPDDDGVHPGAHHSQIISPASLRSRLEDDKSSDGRSTHVVPGDDKTQTQEDAELSFDKHPGKDRAMPESAAFQSTETFEIFMAEAVERLAQAQAYILRLEEVPSDTESIRALFRIFHTLKGESGFLKIASLGELSHNLESLLDLLQSGRLKANSTIIDTLLTGVDLSKEILSGLRHGDVAVFNRLSLDDYLAAVNSLTGTAKPVLGDMLVRDGKLSEAEVLKILHRQKESGYDRKFGEIAVEENLITEGELHTYLGAQEQAKEKPELGIRSGRTDVVVKVRASKIDFIVDMVGELLIAQGQLGDDSPVIAQFRKITRTLQIGAMELRTDSPKYLFGSIRRLARDVSKKLGKPARFETSGEDLEIDRNLLEKLEEPLLHLVRNSIDHGIESPDVREAAGKPAEGLVRLTAERKGNNIVITVADDGGGLNTKRIAEKAVEKGLVKPEAIAALTEKQVHNFIFHSGFSTRDEVDYISGRGMGMDIVRTVVGDARGRVEISSEPGRGTAFTLVFPLSTAIIDGMVIRVGANLLIVPISSIVEALKIKQADLSMVNGTTEVLTLRDEVLPVISLRRTLGITCDRQETNGTIPLGNTDTIGIVVENSDRQKFVMRAEEILNKREVVIKSLGPRFRHLKAVSAGTVLAGGAIGLVLDVDRIVDLSLRGDAPDSTTAVSPAASGRPPPGG